MNNLPHNSHEQGSALLLTLGILALVMVLAVTFVFSSRTELQVAKANADSTSVDLLLESAVPHAIKSMTLAFLDDDNNPIPFPARWYTTAHNESTGDNQTGPAPAQEVDTTDFISLNRKFTQEEMPYFYLNELPEDEKLQEGMTDVAQQLWNYHPLCRKIMADPAHQDPPDQEEPPKEDSPKLTLDLSDAQWHYVQVVGKKKTPPAAPEEQDPDSQPDEPPRHTIGRFTYLIIPDGEKLDLNQMLAATKRPSEGNIIKYTPRLTKLASPEPATVEDQLLGSLRYQIDTKDVSYFIALTNKKIVDLKHDKYTLKTSDASLLPKQPPRLGIHPMELVPDVDLFDTPINSQKILQPWFSYLQLLNHYPVDSFLDYRLFSPQEPEAFAFIDTPSEPSETPEPPRKSLTLYSRFDITGYEQSSHKGQEAVNEEDNEKTPDSEGASSFWNTVKPEDLMAPLSSSPQFPHVAKTIPYLQKLEDLDTLQASKTTPQHLGLQVAANLIDYSDSNNAATIPPADVNFIAESNTKDTFLEILQHTDRWKDIKADPPYWGNEKVLYFNEIAFKTELKLSDGDDSKNPGKKLTVNLTPTIEMADIFGDGKTIPGDIRLQLTVELAIAGKSIQEQTFTFKEDTNISRDHSTAPPSEYTTITMIQMKGDKAAEDNALFTTSQHLKEKSHITLTVSNVIACSSNGWNSQPFEPYDFACYLDSITIHDTEVDTNIQLVKTSSESSLEVKDPRYNHRTDAWQFIEGNSLRKNNSTLPTAPSEDSIDMETYDSVRFSTAYIRNAPMETFWELGAIHRGEPFRTLNLNVFSDSAGDYGQGDAEILDQLKIGPLKFVKGRYNAYSRNAASLELLLNGIKPNPNMPPHQAYDVKSMTFGGQSIHISFDHDFPDSNRGSLATILGTLAQNLDGFTTDRAREAFIGRTANLLTTRSDPYTVLIIAQSLKEIDKTHYDNLKSSLKPGTELSDLIVNPLEVGDRRFSILGTKTMTLYLIRDAWTNQFTTVHREIHNR